jgi:hypothetical protein
MFNGWNRSNTLGVGGVGIHHPRGDLKKISTHNITPNSNSNCSSHPQNWWGINWTSTLNGFSVTQTGSSGSPLFDNNHLIVGQLYGPQLCAPIQCPEPSSQNVIYGRLSVSWAVNSNIRRQLANWLDPCNTEQMSLQGGYLVDCINPVLVNQPITVGGVVRGKNIIASSTIDSNANSEFVGGTSVTLDPGFHAMSGSDFIARIEPCTSEVLPLANKKDFISNENIKNAVLELPYLKLFPNPTSNDFTIQFYINKEEKVEILIQDMSGRRVAVYNNKHVANNVYEVNYDASNFAKGTYLVTILTSDFKETQKIIVK